MSVLLLMPEVFAILCLSRDHYRMRGLIGYRVREGSIRVAHTKTVRIKISSFRVEHHVLPIQVTTLIRYQFCERFEMNS